MKKMEKILCWNCRGASNKEFLHEMRELTRQHRPTKLILHEPMISGMTVMKVCSSLKKTHWVCPEVEGFSDGIWVLWDAVEIQLQPLYIHKQFNQLDVCSAGRRHRELTPVYACPISSS